MYGMCFCWQSLSFPDRDSGYAVELSVEQDGHYAIIVCGDGTGSSLDLPRKVK
jgi:hypothetical protein